MSHILTNYCQTSILINTKNINYTDLEVFYLNAFTIFHQDVMCFFSFGFNYQKQTYGYKTDMCKYVLRLNNMAG